MANTRGYRTPEDGTYPDIALWLNRLAQDVASDVGQLAAGQVGLLDAVRAVTTTIKDSVATISDSDRIQSGRLAALESKAGFTGPVLDLQDQAVNGIVANTGSLTRLALAALFAGARETTTVRNSSVIVKGAKADYTGEFRVGTGVGTDDRAAIQAALDAAYASTDPSFWGYLRRRSVTVKLPAGFYLIGAPADGTSSLKVPPGVTFDFSDATLFFDYPAAPTNAWGAIYVPRFANVRVGKMNPSRRNAAPDTAKVYDGIRLFQNINSGTKVTGYNDSEIYGFQGAGIRGIGAWITHIAGLRLADNKYGYVASNYGDGYNMPRLDGGTGRWVHTEMYLTDCQFIRNTDGGFLGVVQGKAGNINTVDYADSGLSLWFKNCSFEDMGSFAIYAVNTFNLGVTDCHFEEVGQGNGMCYFDTARVAVLTNNMVNLAGRSVPGPTGNVTPNPFQIFNCASVQSLKVNGLYVHNTKNAALRLMDNTPGSYSIEGLFTDALPMLAGPGVTSHMSSLHLRGTWDRPLLIGTTRLWADSTGALRQKTTAPANADDGTLL